jgi:excinuclease ABC subunit B
MPDFKVQTDFKPAGDQPRAIEELTHGLENGQRHQTLLGVTGSGKTFTMANVIARHNKPALVISPNKILAAQLYAEFKSFFPENAVEYFISYYDYYQPEAYVPQSDTYIEKDASINDHIDRLRLKATSSLLERNDVIVVASVSCIYGLGAPENFKEMCVALETGKAKPRTALLQELINIHYERNETDFHRGTFRVKGDTIEIFPAYLETALRVELEGDVIDRISEIRPLTGMVINRKERSYVYPARHFVTDRPTLERAVTLIQKELKNRLEYFRSHDKLIEAQRIEQRTNYDLEMMRHLGFCHGIENYSRHLSGRKPGERPACLIDYFPKDFLTMIDESHVTIPQIGGMHAGDLARKQTLVDYGFRLPSAVDNRPLKFLEFEGLVNQTVYVSATPGPYELKKSQSRHSEAEPKNLAVVGKTERSFAHAQDDNLGIVEQVIRPTGLVDPDVEVVPTKGQIDDLMKRIEQRVSNKERVLVTTLTKRMAEDLSEFLSEKGLKVRYLHSEIEALARVEIIKDLRKGAFDVLVGINLLREGLDLPEVSLVAVLDADKEGFLRSETTLIQVCGRAARNVNGEVVLYADKTTGSMERALNEMNRRREKQIAYNAEHRITPKTVQRAIQELEEFQVKAHEEGLKHILADDGLKNASRENLPHILKDIDRQMKEAADALDFELAAILRDKTFAIKDMMVKTSKRKARVV